MITIRVLDQDILRRRLDTDALISIGDFEIMQVAFVGTGQIDAIAAADIRASDREIVGFEVRDTVEDEVESGRVNENEIMNRQVCDGDET